MAAIASDTEADGRPKTTGFWRRPGKQVAIAPQT